MKARSEDSAGTALVMKTKSIPAIVIMVVVLAVVGGIALAAQDKYTVRVPNGLAFSEFRGYEDWQVVAVSQPKDLLVVILANPVMIDAYRAGVPGNGKPFPDGSKMAKIHWNPKKSAEAPAPTMVPDTLHDVDFMERDSKRFADSGNWGWWDTGAAPRSGYARSLVGGRCCAAIEQRGVGLSTPPTPGPPERCGARRARQVANGF